MKKKVKAVENGPTILCGSDLSSDEEEDKIPNYNARNKTNAKAIKVKDNISIIDGLDLDELRLCSDEDKPKKKPTKKIEEPIKKKTLTKKSIKEPIKKKTLTKESTLIKPKSDVIDDYEIYDNWSDDDSEEDRVIFVKKEKKDEKKKQKTEKKQKKIDAQKK